MLLCAVSLVGQSAPPEVLQKLTYLVIRHPQVKRIDTVRAYTFGVLYFVEVSPYNHFLFSLRAMDSSTCVSDAAAMLSSVRWWRNRRVLFCRLNSSDF